MSDITERAARIGIIEVDRDYDDHVIAVDGYMVGLVLSREEANVVRAWLIGAIGPTDHRPWYLALEGGGE